MKKTLLFVIILVLSNGLSFSQTAPLQDTEEARRKARLATFDARVDELRNNGKQRYIRDRYRKDKVFIQAIRPLYRKLTKEEKELLAPEKEYEKKYADFIRKENSGVIKLLADKGCDLGTEIVSVKPECEKYKMPGAGSSYSFRSRRYRVKHLADISFTGEKFDTNGLIKNGVLASIGDVFLDKLSLKSEKLGTIVSFKPPKTYKEAFAFSTSLEKGIRGNNVVYGSSIKVEADKTYLLRSIAYKTKYYKQVENVVYDEFDFDERRDVIVVFRVIEFQPQKSVTIVWKELRNKQAPKMQLPKKKSK